MSKLSTFPRALFDFYKDNGSNTVFNTVGPSLTRQEFQAECDINTIMSRYEAAGAVNGLLSQAPPPNYIDFSEVPDNLMDYLHLMQASERSFMTLPAAIRREFDNDPHLFVDFASDPNNLDQMREWGLAAPAKPAEPAPPVPAAPAPPASPAAPAAPHTPST